MRAESKSNFPSLQTLRHRGADKGLVTGLVPRTNFPRCAASRPERRSAPEPSQAGLLSCWAARPLGMIIDFRFKSILFFNMPQPFSNGHHARNGGIPQKFADSVPAALFGKHLLFRSRLS